MAVSISVLEPPVRSLHFLQSTPFKCCMEECNICLCLQGLLRGDGHGKISRKAMSSCSVMRSLRTRLTEHGVWSARCNDMIGWFFSCIVREGAICS